MEIRAIKWQISEPWQICLLLCRSTLPWLRLGASISLLIPAISPARVAACARSALAQGSLGLQLRAGSERAPGLKRGGAAARDALRRDIEGEKIKKTQQELEIPVKNAASVRGPGMAEGKGERSAWCRELSSVPALPTVTATCLPGAARELWMEVPETAPQAELCWF